MKKLTMMLIVCLFAGHLMAQTIKKTPPPPPAAPHAKVASVSAKHKAKKETVKFTPPTIVKDKP